MTKLLKVFFITFFIIFEFYLLLPNPDLPIPPPDSFQSGEPADTETPLRRAYFTDFTREEVMNYYKKQLEKSPLLSIPLPTYKLNYPPEDAQTLIRDQTRSTFLEELVHPFRESLFVNGFEPKEAKDEIWYKGVHFRQKIIIRYAPSNILVRVIISLLALGAFWFLMREWRGTAKWTFRL